MEDKKLDNLISLSDESFAKYLLREDLFYGKIENKAKIISESLELGRKVGKDKKNIFSDIFIV